MQRSLSTIRQFAIALGLAAAAPIQAHAGLLNDVLGGAAPVTSSVSQIEVGYSPEGSAEQLVEKAIHSARKNLRVAAYSFTSPAIVRALIDAKRRGVDVAVLVDEKNNLKEDRSGKAQAALNLLVNAGIPTRTIKVYPIHHDKYIVADGGTVETGSFNYSDAAARRNSENAIVMWHAPTLAKSYLEHWQSRWDQGTNYTSSY